MGRRQHRLRCGMELEVPVATVTHKRRNGPVRAPSSLLPTEVNPALAARTGSQCPLSPVPSGHDRGQAAGTHLSECWGWWDRLKSIFNAHPDSCDINLRCHRHWISRPAPRLPAEQDPAPLRHSAQPRGVLQHSELLLRPFAPPWQGSASAGEVRVNPSHSHNALPSLRCPPSPGLQLLQTPTLRVPVPLEGSQPGRAVVPNDPRGTQGCPTPPFPGPCGRAGAGSSARTSNKLLLNN